MEDAICEICGREYQEQNELDLEGFECECGSVEYKIINNDDGFYDVYAMAQIEEIGQMRYYVNSRGEHNPPHFHFERTQKGIDGKRKGRILFESAEYLRNPIDKWGELSASEKKDLYQMLQRKIPNDDYGRTYWIGAIDDWNKLQHVDKIDKKKHPNPPDYTKMR